MNLEEFKEYRKQTNWTPWRKYFYEYSEKEIDSIINQISILSDYFFNKFDYHLYLIYGTLLGAIRDNNLIMWDYDIDLAYLSKYNNKTNVKKEFLEIYNTVKNEFNVKKLRYTGWFTILKDTGYDICVSYIKNNQYYCIPGIRKLDSSSIIPLKKYQFHQTSVFIPNKSENILDHCFVNWKVPIVISKNKKLFHKQITLDLDEKRIY